MDEALVALACLAREPQHKVVIVDNDSSPEQRNLLRREGPSRLRGLQIVWNKTNAGFPSACNQAVDLVTTPFAALLNCDLTWQVPLMNELLDEIAARSNVAAIQPLVLDTSGKVDSGGAFQTPLGFLYLWQHQANPNFPDHPFAAHSVQGSFMVWRTDIYRGLGGMDPRFFLYFEESDLCHRALNAGYEVLVDPLVSVVHVGGTSTSSRRLFSEKLSFRNRAWSLCRNLPWQQVAIVLPLHLVAVFLYALLNLLKDPIRSVTLASAALRGVGRGLLERERTRRKSIHFEHPPPGYFWAQSRGKLNKHRYTTPKLVRNYTKGSCRDD